MYRLLYLKSSIHFIQMTDARFRFINGALKLRGFQRVAFQEPPPVFPAAAQTVTIPVVEPAPAPAPEPVVAEPAPAPEPAQVAEIPVAEPESKVEAPAEVPEASPESGLVPEDPPAE